MFPSIFLNEYSKSEYHHNLSHTFNPLLLYFHLSGNRQYIIIPYKSHLSYCQADQFVSQMRKPFLWRTF
jgi:hypothetical protein